MVHVLLLILKVLGITLLILLGVVILVLLLALLAPFSYRIDAEYYGELRAVGRIRWLCFVLDFKGLYGNSRFLYYLKSFGFTISTNDESAPHFQRNAEQKGIPPDDEELRVPIKVVEDDFDSFVDEPEPIDVIQRVAKETVAKETDTNEKEPVGDGRKRESVEDERMREPAVRETLTDSENRQGLFLRIHDKIKAAVEWITSIPMRIHYKILEILSRILDFFANIKENISRLVEKKNEITAKVTEVRHMLQKESTKKAWKDSMHYLQRLWKHIRPKRFQGTVRFGMEDPSTTGQILGAISLLIPLYRDHLVVAPDFEQQILEGEIFAKGRVQIGFFLTLFLQIIWNRNLIQTIQEIRTIIGGNK